MITLVFFATAWGSKHGGINVVNYELCCALGALLGEQGRVVCVVPFATDSEIQDALASGVELMHLGLKQNKLDRFDVGWVGTVELELRGRDIESADCYIGHDVISGETANRIRQYGANRRSMVISHMSYRDYRAVGREEYLETQEKIADQKTQLSSADVVAAVGPLLQNRAIDLSKRDVPMIVPGLAPINPITPSRQFFAVSFGRFNRSNDRIKQIQLAAEAFAEACKLGRERGGPSCWRDNPTLKLIGVDSEQEELKRILAAMHERAEGIVNICPLPFQENRQDLFDQVAESSVALMLSWHEGFGLTGWEAIAAEVPLIVTEQSGLYQLLLAERLESLVMGLPIKGRIGEKGIPNFTDEDRNRVAEAIGQVSQSISEKRQDARNLKSKLAQYTWERCARDVLTAMGVDHSGFGTNGGPPPDGRSSPQTGGGTPNVVGIANVLGAQLNRVSNATALYLASFGYIKLGSAEVSLRRGVLNALLGCVQEESLVVVGEPGVGKTGLLGAVAQALKASGVDVVALTAEEMFANRDAILDEIAENASAGPGVILVDALDSLRDDQKAASVRKTLGDIERLNGRWKIVASIRTFDLYQGSAMAQLFAGTPPTAYQDKRFSHVRHVFLGPLADEEIEPLREKWPDLWKLLTATSADLQVLLRIPLHLALAASLITDGLRAGDFAQVSTRVELLNLYWKHRVGDLASLKDAREVVARQMCDRMIAQRSLQCSKVDLEPNRLYDLLTAGVVGEPPISAAEHDDSSVAFSHHVLFDYVVARLWLPRDSKALTQRLAADPHLPFVIRPSLDMLFEILWVNDSTRKTFWGAVIQLCHDTGIREIGKIIGPNAAAIKVRSWRDIQPLVDELTSVSGTHSAADSALRYTVFALTPQTAERRVPFLAAKDVWAQLASECSTIERDIPRRMVCRLLSMLTEEPSTLTPGQMQHAGVAARTLLNAVERAEQHTPWMLLEAIRFVCRTFVSQPVESGALIMQLLTHERLKIDGFRVMPAVAREIESLFEDPELVEYIYCTAFAFKDNSFDTTVLGGIVLGLSSNRRQDYRSGLYSLQKSFPKFMDKSPRRATLVLIQVIKGYADHEHPPHSGEIIEEPFGPEGMRGRLRTDHSAIWDSDVYRGDHELSIANSWQKAVERLAGDPRHSSLLESLFEACLEHNVHAFVWRRWLALAGNRRIAATMGQIVLPLLQSSYVLWAIDTSYLAGEALRTVFGTLTTVQRESVERAILEAGSFEKRKERQDETLARLLGCIDRELLVTDEAKQMATVFRDGAVHVENVPVVTIGRMRPVRAGIDDWLQEQGVPINEEPHLTIHRACRELEANRKLSNSDRCAIEPISLLAEAERLAEAVSGATTVHPRVVDNAWGEISQTLLTITAYNQFLEPGSLRTRVLRVAEKVLRCPCPRYAEHHEANFDATPSWGTPHARGDLAELLVALLTVRYEEQVFGFLEKLANDEVVSVRFRAVRALGELVRTADSERFWRVLDKIVKEETSRGVHSALVAGPLAALRSSFPERVTESLSVLVVQYQQVSEKHEAQALAYQLLARVFIEHGEVRAEQLVFEYLRDPTLSPSDDVGCTHRDDLVRGLVQPASQMDEAARARAQDLFRHSIRTATTQLAQIQAKYPTGLPVDLQQQARNLVTRLDAFAHDIYFSLGSNDQENSSPAVGRDVGNRLLTELGDTLLLLGGTQIPSVVHPVLESLEILLECNPSQVFPMVVATVIAGEAGGYQYDSLAIAVIVKIVGRMLGDYRPLLQNDPSLRDGLLDVLDVFVRVGWPQAQKLAYDLHEVFR